MPEEVVHTICRYLGRPPHTVVDLGSGTGLSTIPWQGKCNKIIGIEPSRDMYTYALSRQNANTIFYNRYAQDTGLENESADVVVCSQSFHWMEPFSTLKEINRILKNKGIFVAVDCDWPPLCTRETEEAYCKIFSKVRKIKKEHPELEEKFHMWNKAEHLENIRKSKYFSFTREAVFSAKEKCNGDRFIKIALSQGSVQNIIKYNEDLIADALKEFQDIIENEFVDTTKTIIYNYRMRIGIK